MADNYGELSATSRSKSKRLLDCVEGSLSRVVGMDGRSSPRREKREREREREKKRVKGDTRKRKRRSDKVKGIEKYSLNRE